MGYTNRSLAAALLVTEDRPEANTRVLGNYVLKFVSSVWIIAWRALGWKVWRQICSDAAASLEVKLAALLEARKDKRKLIQNQLSQSSHLIYTYLTRRCTSSSQIKLLSQIDFSDLKVFWKKKKRKNVLENWLFIVTIMHIILTDYCGDKRTVWNMVGKK